MEEFEKLVAESFQSELIPAESQSASAESATSDPEPASENVSETETAG
jgi:hypothetical protein